MSQFRYYFCPGCKKRIKREVRIPAPRFFISFCNKSQTHCKCRLSRNQQYQEPNT